MAVFTLPGTLLGFRRDRSGAQLVKCTRDDGAPTLLMQPRPGGPPLYEKDIEVYVSATKQYGLAVTVARSDGSFEHTLGDILGDACENVDLATKRKWTWWSGGVVRPEPKGPAVKPRGPGKSASPVVVRKPTPMPKPERSDQPVPVPEATAQPSSSEASSPSTSEVPREEPAPPSAPTAAADMEAAARVAVVFARQLIPLFVVGFGQKVRSFRSLARIVLRDSMR